MARRRHENGLKYQQRIEREQLRNRRTDAEPDAPVPPGVTQLLESAAPPPYAPHDSATYATHDPHEPHER
jgi:hypothetical protein